MRHSTTDKQPVMTPDALMGATILVVDDDEDVRIIVSEALRAGGAKVELAADGIEALEALDKGRFDVIISDVRMPRCDGLQLLAKVRAKHIDVGFIVMTGFFDVPASQIISLGGHEVLSKPFEAAEVFRSVQAYLRRGKRAKP